MKGKYFKEEKIMKNMIGKKGIKRLVAVLLAIVIIGVSSKVALAAPYYPEANVRFDAAQNSKITIRWKNEGLYKAKNIKIWGKKITGVNEWGDFEFGGWELIDTHESACLGDSRSIQIPATYVDIAFSFDIVWGTDFPFSGLIYELENGPTSRLDIEMGGTVRCASFKVSTPEQGVIIDKHDCQSHDEFDPFWLDK